MESATVRSAPPLPALIQLGLIALLLAAAAVAWALSSGQMAGMDAGPGTALGSLGFFLGTWVLMMAAMMFPSIAPMVLMFARIQEGRRGRGESVPSGVTPLFIAGYLIIWAAAGLFAYAVFELGRAVVGDAFAWDAAGPYLAGGIIVAAAVYQLTPLKDVCLRHCRSPLFFLMNHSKPGRAGAVRMGIEHGGYCVGCCWMLMAALFALGIMSIGWMAFIAALIAIEKLLPWPRLASQGIAVLLVVLGLAVAFAPERVPGLVLPDSPEAAQAMKAMGMESGGMEMKSGQMQSGGMKSNDMQSGGMQSNDMQSGGMKSNDMQSGGMKSDQMHSDPMGR
jgi:predicted metal-binding membrane protein